MAIPGYVNIHNKDQGWVVTTNTDKMPTEAAKKASPTVGAGRGGGMGAAATRGPADKPVAGRGYRMGFGRGQQPMGTTGAVPRARGNEFDAVAARALETGHPADGDADMGP